MNTNLLYSQIPRKGIMPLYEETTQENKGIGQEVGVEGDLDKSLYPVSHRKKQTYEGKWFWLVCLSSLSQVMES